MASALQEAAIDLLYGKATPDEVALPARYRIGDGDDPEEDFAPIPNLRVLPSSPAMAGAALAIAEDADRNDWFAEILRSYEGDDTVFYLDFPASYGARCPTPRSGAHSTCTAASATAAGSAVVSTARVSACLAALACHPHREHAFLTRFASPVAAVRQPHERRLDPCHPVERERPEEEARPLCSVGDGGRVRLIDHDRVSVVVGTNRKPGPRAVPRHPSDEPREPFLQTSPRPTDAGRTHSQWPSPTG